MFGNPETTTGGRALKFYASVRMDVRRIETLKQGGEVIGNRTRVKVVKNKVAPPFKEAEFDIMFGKGISAVGDILDLAANVGIVQKSGAWFAYNENKIGQGRENAKQFLTEHPDMLAEIDEKVRAHYGIGEEKEDSEAVDKKEKLQRQQSSQNRKSKYRIGYGTDCNKDRRAFGKAQAGLYQWGTGICALQYGSAQVRHCRGKSACAGRP